MSGPRRRSFPTTVLVLVFVGLGCSTRTPIFEVTRCVGSSITALTGLTFRGRLDQIGPALRVWDELESAAAR